MDFLRREEPSNRLWLDTPNAFVAITKNKNETQTQATTASTTSPATGVLRTQRSDSK
jgi:hypothetical protein